MNNTIQSPPLDAEWLARIRAWLEEQPREGTQAVGRYSNKTRWLFDTSRIPEAGEI